MSEALELLDWRRHVAELFADLRRRPPNAETLAWFRAQKDDLFRHHPQSPIPETERSAFTGLTYWPHDPEARVLARFVAAPPSEPIPASVNPSEATLRLVGHLEFTYHQRAATLGAYWVEGYGGGLIVPFKDATSNHATYGGGRYALDTIKSADLGSDWAANTVVLDFNYAYHPSCVYDPHWVCPLAPPENTLPFLVEAGEQLPAH